MLIKCGTFCSKLYSIEELLCIFRFSLSKKEAKKLLRNATILNNGSVIRVRREKSSDEESSSEEEDSSDEEESNVNDAPEADQQHQPEPEVRITF